MTKKTNAFWCRYYDQVLQIIPWEGIYAYRKQDDFLYFFRGLFALIYNLFIVWRKYGINFSTQIAKKPILFYYETINQYNSLRPLIDSYQLYSSAIKHPQLNKINATGVVPLFKIYIQAILSYTRVWWRCRNLFKRYSGRMNKNHVLVNAALAQAAWNWSYSLLQNNPCKVIVISNDHLFIPVSLMFIARELGIKTVYLQHASVTSVFPPLYVDYALLDGEKAKAVYMQKQLEPFVDIKLVGMLKADGFVRLKKNIQSVKMVGVCINGVDNIQKIEKLVEVIRKDHPDIDVIVRLHPALSITSDVFSLVKRISYPKQEAIWEFLKGIDLLVAGESSVHVEASIMNIPSFYFNSTNKNLDYYGFIEEKLVENYFDKPEDFTACLNKLDLGKDFTSRAKPFCDTIGTSFENRSLSLAKQHIDSLIK